MKNKFVLAIALAAMFTVAANAKSYKLVSPDGNLQVEVDNSKVLTWNINYDGKAVLNPSEISLSINGMKNPLGVNAKVSSVSTKKVADTQQVVVPTKKKVIDDVYNSMLIKFAGGYAVEFRAYDNGAAYRFITSSLPLKGTKEMEVENETVQFNFPANTTAYWPYDKYRAIDFQNCYEVSFKPNFPVDSVKESVLGVLPVYFTTPDGYKVVVTETEVVDYPNFFLQGSGSSMLTGVFPPVILKSELKPGSDRGIRITETAPYIADTRVNRDFPWRIVTVNKDDNGVFENTLPYQLASSSKVADTSWIKPGKISWDWWSMLNVYGVDFEAGVNTPTYKYI
ncbi:MAG: glycoside hydrolase family 97 N-terminal domain-containing protein, partial [Muribaculaceae bacterium]|nr:glycoside hydrolase family 97 N-terminal domain-containing protein [Muribaculaceae bacterium]